MRQTRVLYLHPASETAEPVAAALEAAAPGLSVSRTSSPSEARALLDTDSVDCLVVARPSADEMFSLIETARSSAPTVPVLRFTDEPPHRVVERFDVHTDYLYKQEPTEQAALLAHRIRTLVAADSPSAAAADSDAIVDSSYAGILVFDAEGRITLLNPAAERMLGFPAADAIGNSCETLDMRTDRDEPLAQHDRPVVRVLDSGEPVVDELVSVPADEGRRWLSISASPLANGETVGGVVVTLDDVSAEVELETTLETVLDRMTDGFVAFDTDLRFTYLSERAIDPERYAIDDVLGSRLSDLHPHLGQYEADLRTVLETQEPKTVETHIPEPTDAWYRARLYPSESGVSVFVREITDEKRQERRLEQYRTIVESVKDGVCILDSAMEFVFVNEAFAELVGYTEAELLGENAALVTDEADMELARKRRGTLFGGAEDAAILSGELTTGSGDRIPVETWMTPIELVDGEQGTVGVVRDLSYRKETEATFTALYDAAHDLLSARTNEEIAAIGVEAAASVLGFEDAVVLAYDGETNAFRPLAYTPSAEEHLPAPLPISASDSSIAGRAFFDSELVVTDDMRDLPEAYNAGTVYRRAMFVPLDDHAVLFVGDTETGSTTEHVRTVAELLGATLAAAFGRLSSDRQSEAHLRTLAERTAELETLTHTNALVEAVGDRLFDASTREGIEDAVCAVLTDFDRYRFAWVGTADPRTDTIVPRAAAGLEEGYLDWLTERTAAAGTGSVQEPTCRVLATDSPVSVGRVARDWQTAPWRKEALSRGYQSVFSVPLRYDEITYGVLSIYASRRDGFDEYTRAVLAEFGRVIAYAIECTETRRGVLAEHRTEIELDIGDGDDPLSELAGRLGTTLRFEGIVPQHDGHSLLYVRVSDRPADAVETAVAEVGAIDALRIITQQPEATLFEATVSGPLLAETLVDCGAIPIRIETDADRHEVAVTIPQATDVRTVLDRIKAAYPSTTVVSRRDRDWEIQTRSTFRMQLLDRLTARQQEALRAAYFARYFESPRGSTGTELGDSLGISQPTFNYHLRAALKTVLTTLFEPDAEQRLDS